MLWRAATKKSTMKRSYTLGCDDDPLLTIDRVLFRGYIDKLNMGQVQHGATIGTLLSNTDDTIIHTEVLATRGAEAKTVKGNRDLKVDRICKEER